MNTILQQSIRVSLILSAFVTSAFAADAGPAPPIPHATRKLSAAQLNEANARVQLANSIASHVSQDAEAKGADPSWRINLLSRLYKLNSAQLRSIEPNATTLDQAHALASAARAASRSSQVDPKALGDASDDLVFVPKTPCRFIDTRQSSGGGPISTTRDFDTFEEGQDYGGATGCTLPGKGEIAFAANVTVVIAAGAAGYIGIRPYGSTNSTSFLNWPTGGAPSGLANAGIITTAQDSNASNDYVFEVFNGGTTSPQVILDYFGYFEPPGTGSLSCVVVGTAVGSTAVAEVTLPANSNAYYNTTACPSGYTVTTPYCWSQLNSGVFLNGSGVTGQGNGFEADAFCSFQNTSSSAQSANVGTTCCATP